MILIRLELLWSYQNRCGFSFGPFFISQPPSLPTTPGSQLALPRLTGNLPHGQKAARPEINPYQPLLNQLRFPPTIQWVSSRRAPFEPVSSLPAFGMYANLDPTSLAMPPNSSLPSYASPTMPSPSTPYVRLPLLPLFVIPLYLLCSLPPRPLPTSRIHQSSS